jgi:hypothetical protein
VPAYRCDACGNKTRFDVVETKRVKAYHHYSLGGDLTIEDEEVLDSDVERVVCRWCGAAVDPVGSAPAAEDGS